MSFILPSGMENVVYFYFGGISHLPTCNCTNRRVMTVVNIPFPKGISSALFHNKAWKELLRKNLQRSFSQ